MEIGRCRNAAFQPLLLQAAIPASFVTLNADISQMPESAVATLLTGAVALAKPVVETGCKLVESVLGEPCRIAGNLLSDQIYAWQWANRIRIAHKTKKILEVRGIAERVMPSGFLIPLLDKAGDVDDPTLQDMWAQLLASAIDSDVHAHPGFIHTLSLLTPNEAMLLSARRRFFELMYCSDPAYARHNDRLLPYLRSHVADAIELKHAQLRLYGKNLDNLRLGSLETKSFASFNRDFETPKPWNVRWAEFPPPVPIECQSVFVITEYTCKPSSFGLLFLAACAPNEEMAAQMVDR